jgi:hypothetical protein
LAFVSWLTLSFLLMPWPVPRGWALPAALLTAVQTFALRSMREAGDVVVGSRETADRVDTLAEAVGVLYVPVLTAGLIVVVLYHLARANARLRRQAAVSGHGERHAHRLRRSGG